MDDMVLNVRQIAQYPESQAQAYDWLVAQANGIGGPYYSTTIQDLLAAGVGLPAPSAMNPLPWVGNLFSEELSLDWQGAVGFNTYLSASPGVWATRRSGPAALIYQDAPGNLNFDFAAPVQAGGTVAFVQRLIVQPDGTVQAQRLTLSNQGQTAADVPTIGWIETQAVRSFNGRFGRIMLNRDDILRAGGAAAYDTVLEGQPLAPTADGECKHQIANVETVEMRVAAWINGLINEHPFCFTFNDRRGDIWLRASDITEASFRDPNEVPEVPTAADGTATDQIASTAFVAQGLQDLQDWVENELATSGDVTMAYLQANYAPLFNPNLVGIPQAPTANPGTSTGQIATTAFVMNAVADSTAGVASFNTRTGHIVLTTQDILDAGGAPLASPTFTGTPQAPTPAPGNSSTQIATTAFVATSSVGSFNGRTGAVTLSLADITGAGGAPSASPFFTGSPQAPTLPPGTNNQQIATTAFVMAEVAASTAGVASFNGRTGNVSLLANDISAAGGATVASPTFTGTPSAPTAAPDTATSQLATTAFVMAALGSGNVASFNGRTGAVTLTAADVNAVVSIANPANTLPLMDGAAAIGTALLYARQDHVHPSDTTRLPLAGGTVTGNLGVAGNLGCNGALTQGSNWAVNSAGFMQGNSGALFSGASMTSTPNSAGLVQIYNCVLRSDYYIGYLGGSPNSFAGTPSLSWGAGFWGPIGAAFGRADTTSQWLYGFLWGTSTLLTGIGTNGSTILYNTGSDRRMKDNIHDLDEDVDVGEMIDAMRPVAFNWRHLEGIVGQPGRCLITGEVERRDKLRDAKERIPHVPVGKPTKIGHGFIAQDLIKIAPWAVSAPNDGEAPLRPYEHGALDAESASMPWGIDYGKLVPYLVAELQNLRRRVAALEG